MICRRPSVASSTKCWPRRLATVTRTLGCCLRTCARCLRRSASKKSASLIEHWAAEGGPGLPSRQASTARLTTLMQTATRRPVSRRGVGLFALGLIGVFGLGLGVAWLSRGKPLLTPSSGKVTHVERKSSAEAQYVYALMVDNEDAWRSVVAYFPDQLYFANRAEQQLARTYMQQDDYPRALALFEKFADMNDTEVDFRAFGLAGAAAALALQGQTEEAAKRLADLWPLREKLDAQTKSWIVQLIAKNGRLHHDKTLQQWDQWLQPKGKSGSGGGAKHPAPTSPAT